METVWIAVALIACIMATIFFPWFYIRKTIDKISHLLGGYLNGNMDISKEIQETRESKIAIQLRTILERAEYEKRRAKQEKEEVAALISDISHQLKTPLANFSMYMDLLKEEGLSEEERQEFIRRINEQQNRMEWLTRMLVRISRLEVGIIEFEAAPNEIKETLAKSVSTVYAAMTEKNIQIKIEEFEDRKLLHSRKWTSEVFINILENAIKYSKENTNIVIRVIPMDIYTKIMFIDEGIGIPKEEYNDIFKRFYRGKQTKEKEGSGLGLYLVQLILEKEGGYVSVDSVVGKGSIFSVFLQNRK